MSPVTYRLATPEEELVFFRRLFDVARRPEFALAGLQGEELDGLLDSQYNARTVHYKGTYPTAEYRLVLFEGELVGGMIVEDRETDLHLIDITILEEWRNRGVGSRVMKDLIDEARGSNRGVLLFVEQFNPAQRLYERLGFVDIELIGIYRQMRWSAASS